MQQLDMNGIMNSMVSIMLVGMVAGMGAPIMLQIMGQKAPADMLGEALRDSLQAVRDYDYWSKRAIELGDIRSSTLFKWLGEDASKHVIQIRSRMTEISMEESLRIRVGR